MSNKLVESEAQTLFTLGKSQNQANIVKNSRLSKYLSIYIQ